MHIKLKRGMSLLMAAALSMSGIGNVVQAAAAEENDDLSTIYETEMQETEVPLYEFTLPYQEECIYQFEEEHLKEPVQDKQEIVLLYEAEEKVEFTLQLKDDWQLDQIHLINQTKTDIPFEWKEDGSISFLMPAEPVWMEADFLRMEEPAESENMMETPATETAEDKQEPGEQIDDITEEPGLEELPVADPRQEPPASDSSSQENEDILQTEPEQETEKLPYQEETDAEDGLPMQGSIVQVEAISIPFDTWDFDQYTDFRNIPYSTDCCMIEYISDDIIYDAVGTYSSIYKVTDQESGKFWFVLRPVQVLESTETVQESELLQEPETEAVTENTIDTAVIGEETELNTEMETVSEADTEMDIMEEQESGYTVYLLENDAAQVILDQETYKEGETVLVSVIADESYEVDGIEVQACDTEDDILMLESPVINVQEIGTTSETMATLSESGQTAEKESFCYTFIMPKSDVLLAVNGESAIMAVADDGNDSVDEDPVPDKFKLVVNGIYTAPSSLKAGDASTTYKTVVFYEEDGSKVTRMAYCIQPKETSPGSGQTYDKDDVEILDGATSKEKKMMKGMYYLYGGPAWGKKIEYADGSDSVNLKTVMSNAGCSSTGHYYTITHYVLSYLYMDGSNWNYNSSESGVLNSSGVNLVKSIVSSLNKLPIPTTELTQNSITSVYQKATDRIVSESITYKAIDENTATITLPDGITLVNENTGKSNTGKVTLEGGTKFHLEAAPDIKGTGNYELKCKYAVDFTALKLKLKGKQDIGFSYYSGDKILPLAVEWAEVPVNKCIELQKYDSETGQKVPRGKGASFANAEYGIYSDAGCSKLVEVVKTNASGYAKSAELSIATYYVKEIKAPIGYQLDPTVYTVEMQRVDELQVYTVSSKEAVRLEKIELQKTDKETGRLEPYNGQASFADAEYTIYADAGCKEKIEVLKTNEKGYAKSSDLLVNTYYIKETKAPKGYLLDETVYTVDMSHTDSISVYTVASAEQVIKKPIEIQKVDSESGLAGAQNSAVSFAGAEYTIYADQSCSEMLEVLITDENGYAKSSDLPVGTYYVVETKAPVGYQADENLYTVTVGEDNKNIYRITSIEQIKRGGLSIMKFLDDSYEESILQDRVESGILSGISFILTHEDKTVPAVKITTDKYGHAATDENALVYGTWSISEDPETVPAGYEGISDVKVTITGTEEILKYVVTNNQPAAQIKLVKKDAHTGNEVAISGGKFQILDAQGNTVTMPDPLNYAKLTDTFTLDERGMIYFTTALKAGTYQIKELEAPEGYLIGENIQFTVTKSHNYQDPMVITFTDEPQMGDIRVKKIDQDTEKLLGEGFVFEIYAAEDITDGSGEIRSIERDGKNVELKKGTLVEAISTNENGIAESGMLYLGKYLVKEKVAGEHYAISQMEYPITLTANAKVTDVTTEVIVKNEKTKAEILKVDASAEAKVLAGIRFRVYSSSDLEAEKARQIAQAIEELRISQNPDREAFLAQQGEALTYFDAEQHTEEERAQFLSVQQKELEAFDDGLQKARDVLEEKLMNELEITDVSDLGAEYSTDENGKIHLEDLQHGCRYFIYETGTLPGYNLDTAVYEFAVDKNGLIDGKSSYSLKIANVPNQLEVTKMDITGDKELPGATLTIRDHEGNVVDTWVSTEEPHRIVGLAAGTYTLIEEQAPEGYAIAENITFTLTDSLQVQQVVMYDDLIKVAISKKDITGDEELPGAKLTITNQAGEVVEEWISGEEPHLVNLAVGIYTLTEVAAPEKYATAETIEFTVKDDLSVQQVTMYDTPIQVSISKKDITGDKELPGAKLTITNQAGEVVEEWISGEDPHLVNLAVGTYTLTEIAAPEKYAKAESILFEVKDTAEIQPVVMYDKLIEVSISKKDITNDAELPGAQLTITDSEGNVIEEWVSTEEPHLINLAAGTYTLTEVAAPAKYAKAENIVFEVTDAMEVQQVVMYDKLIEVSISKKDITNDEELPGAQLIVKDKAGNTVEEWISGEEPHLINLAAGEYTLTEVTAPNGYDVAETITFEVTDGMEVQHVTMYDAPKEKTVDLTGKEDSKTTTVGGSPMPSGGTNVISAPVQTGDYNRYLIPILLILAGTGGMMLLIVDKKKKTKKK